jgi:hypothetical protein
VYKSMAVELRSSGLIFSDKPIKQSNGREDAIGTDQWAAAYLSPRCPKKMCPNVS